MSDTNIAGLPSLVTSATGNAVAANNQIQQTATGLLETTQELDNNLIESAVAASTELRTIQSEVDLQTKSINQQIAEELGRFNASTQQEGEILALPAAVTNLMVLFGDDSMSVRKQKAVQAKSKATLDALGNRRTQLRQTAADARTAVNDRFKFNKSIIETAQDSAKRTFDTQVTLAETAARTVDLFRKLRSDQREEVRFVQEQQDRAVSVLTLGQLANAEQQAASSGVVQIGGKAIPLGLIQQEMDRREGIQVGLAAAKIGLESDNMDLVEKVQKSIVKQMTIPQTKDAIADGGIVQIPDEKGEISKFTFAVEDLEAALERKQQQRDKLNTRQVDLIEAQVEMAAIGPKIQRTQSIEMATLGKVSEGLAEDQDKISRMMAEINADPTRATPEARKRINELVNQTRDRSLARIRKIVPAAEMPLYEAIIEGGDPSPTVANDFLYSNVVRGNVQHIPETDPRRSAVVQATTETIAQFAEQFEREMPVSVGNDPNKLREFQDSLIANLTGAQKTQKLKEFQGSFTQRLLQLNEGIRRQKYFEYTHAIQGTINPMEAQAAGMPELEGQNRFEVAGATLGMLFETQRDTTTGKLVPVFSPTKALAKLSRLKDPITGQTLDQVFLNAMSSPDAMDGFAQFMGSDGTSPSQVALNVVTNGTSDFSGHARGLGQAVNDYRSLLVQPATRRRLQVQQDALDVLAYISENPAVFTDRIISTSELILQGAETMRPRQELTGTEIQFLRQIAAGGGSDEDIEKAVAISVKAKRIGQTNGAPFNAN